MLYVNYISMELRRERTEPLSFCSLPWASSLAAFPRVLAAYIPLLMYLYKCAYFWGPSIEFSNPKEDTRRVDWQPWWAEFASPLPWAPLLPAA